MPRSSQLLTVILSQPYTATYAKTANQDYFTVALPETRPLSVGAKARIPPEIYEHNFIASLSTETTTVMCPARDIGSFALAVDRRNQQLVTELGDPLFWSVQW